MKKIFWLFMIAATITSCSLDDDGVSSFFEATPVESVEIPDEFIKGSTHEIKLNFFNKSDCHSFYQIDSSAENANTRSIAIISKVLTDLQCEDTALIAENQEETIIKFTVGQQESYIFNFWKGVNESGQNEFLTYEIPAVDPDPGNPNRN